MYSGDNRTQTLYARDSANVVASLTGKTITVYVGIPPNDPDNRSAVFTKTGTTISASAGSYSIALVPSDTQDIAGDYAFQGKTVDASGNVAVVTVGRFRVRPKLTS